jgi:TRAP-type C4-dicarboxylate transport system substrate-binding protein
MAFGSALAMSLIGVGLTSRFAPPSCWATSALALLASTVLANAREFRAADIQEENHPTVQAIRHMGQAVSERSGERHTVKVFHSGQLGDEGRTLEQTLAGIIDINRINVIEIGKIVPELNVLALPSLFRSNDHLQKVSTGRSAMKF